MELKDVQGRDLLKDLGLDKVPSWIIEKRVTELMDLRGKKAKIKEKR